MKLKISTTSTGYPKLTAALAAASGKATAHTAKASDLIDAAAAMERYLASLGINKADRPGAEFIFRSGGSVAKSYKYTRKVSVCRAVRGATDWFLVSVLTHEIFANEDGYCRPTLTEKQDSIAVANLRSQYHIA